MALPAESRIRFEPLRWLRTLLLAVGACAVLVAAVYLTFKAKSFYEYHFGFNQQRWLATGAALRAGQEGPLRNSRKSMVYDVMAHYLKPGMTRQQVLATLGPAEVDGIQIRLADGVKLTEELAREVNDRNFAIWCKLHSQPDTIMQYEVGWGLIDPIALDIKLGGDGRVRSFVVVEH